MTDVSKEIIQLKDKINDSKLTKEREQGKLDMLLSDLKKNYGIESFEEAQERVKELQEELDTLQSVIRDDIIDFKNKYGIA